MLAPPCAVTLGVHPGPEEPDAYFSFGGGTEADLRASFDQARYDVTTSRPGRTVGLRARGLAKLGDAARG